MRSRLLWIAITPLLTTACAHQRCWIQASGQSICATSPGLVTAYVLRERQRLQMETGTPPRARSSCQTYLLEWSPHLQRFQTLFGGNGCLSYGPEIWPQCLRICQDLARTATPGEPVAAILRREQAAVQQLDALRASPAPQDGAEGR